MAEIQLKQEFGKYYIVVEYCFNNDSEYLVRMITDNSIRGHLSCRISYEGSKKYLMYEVTNMISLRKEFENKYIDTNELQNLFEEIQNIYTCGNRYLLDESYYYIDPQYIYRDIYSGELKLLYIPGLEVDYRNRYYSLADFLLQRINRKDDICVQIAYQFYRMSTAETFSISMFLNVIQKESIIHKKSENINTSYQDDSEPLIDEDNTEEVNDVNWILPISLTVLTFFILILYICLLKNSIYSVYCIISISVAAIVSLIVWVKNIILAIKQYNEDDFVIPMEPVKVEDYWKDEETVVLQESANEKKSGCRLEWKEKGEDKFFSMKSFPIVIGKMKEEVDCLIEDSSVSRIHAKIINRNHEWIIFDLNSTNGSIVDGERLHPGEEKRIYQGSEIVLGNVSLRVVI